MFGRPAPCKIAINEMNAKETGESTYPRRNLATNVDVDIATLPRTVSTLLKRNQEEVRSLVLPDNGG